MMTDNKNLILAIVLSIAIVLGFELLFNQPQRERALQADRAARDTPTQVVPTAPGEPAPGTPSVSTAPTAPSRPMPAAEQPRVRINAPGMAGSILLQGGRIDDLKLTKYRETVDPGSPPITLLKPQGAPDAYFAEFGWVAAGQGVALPDRNTVWTADRTVLTGTEPVTLTWDNGQGLRFERTIALDGEYMFKVTQRVTNTGGAPVQLHPYGLVARTGTPHTQGFYILHEGPIGVLGGSLHEPNYDDVKEARTLEFQTKGGWLGVTDKYWLTALVPGNDTEAKARFNHTAESGTDRFQADYLGGPMTVAPGESATTTNHFFAGAKELDLLEHYRDALGIDRFDLAIDFGYLWFLTEPIFKILNYFYLLLGNYGLAILLLTVLIKALFFPLANKSYRAMAKMKLLQPEMEKLRERYGEDRARLSQEMMSLYKRAGANPLAGCLPIVVQIPVFFALYKVLFISIEMRHAPFYGWIHDLSAPDPTSIFNLFGLLPWGPPEVYLLGATIGAWPIIMGITMFMQQKLNPQPPDPIQARIFMVMPFIFTVILAPFAAGLVIYWAWNNTLSVLQQWIIMRRMNAKPVT